MEISYLIILLFVILIVWCYWNNHKSNYIKSNIDNNIYLVRDTINKQQAADTLAIIKRNLDKLVNSLNSINHDHPLYKNINLLKKRYTNFYIEENVSLKDTSYTIDKSNTSLCLTTRDQFEDFYDINELMFVTLHELAHVSCENYGHGIEFVIFFTFLLKKSIEIGIYKKVDYSLTPKEYCGVIIDKTPV